jgi:peptidoglycan/xylan/chitin deacetylase (PgdA/CDA1 family)
VTAPEAPRSAGWSRRTVLRAFAPVPLLAVGGCGASGSNSADASAAGATATASSTRGPSHPASPAADARSVAPPQPEVSQAPGVTDAVALTFHGDGSPELAQALLAEAEKADARLTVLAVGQWLAQYPQMAERVLKGGHELGNHTENHLDIDAMSESRAYDEIELCAQRLEQLTGSRGRWFRQSQAQHASNSVRAAATRAGYGTLLSYDLDPLDYTDPGTTTIERNVLNQIHGGDVVSMHLGHPETVTALPVILAGLAKRGLRAVTASELFPLSHPTSHPSQNT